MRVRLCLADGVLISALSVALVRACHSFSFYYGCSSKGEKVDGYMDWRIRIQRWDGLLIRIYIRISVVRGIR